MCSSLFGVEMESYQGDLTDIVRGGTAATTAGSSSSSSDHHQHQHQNHRHVNIINQPLPSWDLQFPSNDPLNLSSTTMDDRLFGDPFSHMRDPLLLHQVEYMSAASAAYYNTTQSSTATTTTTNTTCSVEEGASAGGGSLCQQKSVFVEDDIKSPCNIFSRIQISSSSQSPKLPAISLCDSSPVVMPASSPRGIKAPAMLTSEMINVNNNSKTTTCLLDNTAVPLQISSPRNLGIKRRKSQVKKVVCIPAPAAANSRSSGEVVPSDLWAWRKYGQKPIKGSPYPRGYYRCSSSKGCSARKQVERSRTDPNMLVITYTSEHNHPWPTQRNALAGSTRSQPSKTNNNNANAAASSSKNSPSSSQLQNNTKDNEVKENSNETMSPINVGGASSSAASVKEEFEENNFNENKQFEVEDAADHHHRHLQFSNSSEVFSQIYKPALPDHDIHSNNQSHEDFFADLGEIEADPLNLLFTQGFSTGTGDHDQKESKEAAAALDPFNLFDWSAGDDTHNNNNNNNSFGEEAANRGL